MRVIIGGQITPLSSSAVGPVVLRKALREYDMRNVDLPFCAECIFRTNALKWWVALAQEVKWVIS